MKLHVKIEAGNIKVNEIVEGATAEAVVAAMQKRVASEAGFIVGAVVRKMTPLGFAQEATRRYNAAYKENLPIPQTCEAFVQTGIQKNFATLVEDGTATA